MSVRILLVKVNSNDDDGQRKSERNIKRFFCWLACESKQKSIEKACFEVKCKQRTSHPSQNTCESVIHQCSVDLKFVWFA